VTCKALASNGYKANRKPRLNAAAGVEKFWGLNRPLPKGPRPSSIMDEGIISRIRGTTMTVAGHSASTKDSLDQLTADQPIVIGLDAVIVAVTRETPHVLTIHRSDHALSDGGRFPLAPALPFGPFQPHLHRTLELGMRGWVARQTGLPLGYVEQLYTFGDRYRDPRELSGGPRMVTIGYLALTRQGALSGAGEARWRNWYEFMPWEDWRAGRPGVIDQLILPRLKVWAAGDEARVERVALTFGNDHIAWDPERVLDRYELLYETGLALEAHRDFQRRRLGGAPVESAVEGLGENALIAIADQLGKPMAHDHRRILATAMGRIRGKIKYRPVVFELLPPAFTLLLLQRTVESLSGVRLHKQNFRRLALNTGLVEETGEVETRARGRPAALFRFRREVLRERPAPGVGLPASKA